MRGHYHAPGGVVVVYDAPERIGGVLEAGAPSLARVGWAIDRGDTPSPDHLARLLEWCARHACDVLVGGVPLREEAVDALDEWLSPASLVGLAVAIMEAEQLPADMIEAARSFMGMVLRGGCECRSCSGKSVDLDPRCLVALTPASVRNLVLDWWPLRERVDYDTPVWAYQLHRQFTDASARVTLERHEERERRHKLRDHARSRLRAMGVKA